MAVTNRSCRIAAALATIAFCSSALPAQFGFSPIAPLNSNAATDSQTDLESSLSTDGAGNWVCIWNSNDDLGGTIGLDSDILVARSSNDGNSWTSLAVLNSNAATDTGNDFAPVIATDGAGNHIAVWFSNDTLGGTTGTDNDILFSVSANNGLSWSAVAALNTNAASDTGHDRRPYIASNGAGQWVCVWHSDDSIGGSGTDNDILASTSSNNGTSWSAPTIVNTHATTDTGSDTGAKIATDGAGNWIAVWQSQDSLGGTIGTDNDILYSRSANNGASWSAVAILNTNAATDTGSDANVKLACDGGNNWVAIWPSNENIGGSGTDNDILVARSSNDGVSWSSPALLNANATTDTAADALPHLATDGAGRWLAVWNSGDSLGGSVGPDDEIFISESLDNGATWNGPFALNSNAATDVGFDVFAQIASDGADNWVATWNTADSLGGTIGNDGDIVYATSGTVPIRLSRLSLE